MVYERNCFSGKTLRSISNVKIFLFPKHNCRGGRYLVCDIINSPHDKNVFL